jgi:purine-cytosine permease-like protein
LDFSDLFSLRIKVRPAALPVQFHIAIGALGAIVVMSDKPAAIRVFNVGFGLIDLYQAAASYLDLFPKRLFKWTRVDDILHIVIGLALVIIGISSR